MDPTPKGFGFGGRLRTRCLDSAMSTRGEGGLRRSGFGVTVDAVSTRRAPPRIHPISEVASKFDQYLTSI
jgi:hypothetical protein